jgi:F-type H+-transporting ATPase subunit a
MGISLFIDSSNWLAEFFEAFKEKFIEALGIGDIGEEISQAILQKKISLQMVGMNFLLTDAIIATWVAVGVACLLLIWMASKREKIPTGRQLMIEALIDMLLNLCKSSGMNQKQAEQVVPFVGTVGVFIMACNLASLFKLSPPAKNPAFPIALALVAIVYVVAMGIRFVGIKGFWGSLLEPMAPMLPFKILDYLIKPVSLALRLFGNVFGAYILMEFISILVPAVLPAVLGMWFDLADGILQAVIFSYLTITYIGEIIEGAHIAAEHKKEKEKKKRLAIS